MAVATILPVLTLFPRYPQLDVVRLPHLVIPGLNLHSHPLQNALRLHNSCLQDKSDVATSKLSRPDTNTGKIKSRLWIPWQSLCWWGSKED